MSLLDTASLIVTPNGYKEGKLYSVIPSDGSGDMSVTRATTATRVNSAGLVELVPYNLFLYSEQFDNATWLKSSTTVNANQTTAPNGTNTADKLNDIVSSSPAEYVFLPQNPLSYTSGTPYTVSFYAKDIDRRYMYIRFVPNAFGVNKYVYFDLQNGVINQLDSGVAATITSVGDGWYRCTATYTATITVSTIFAVYIGLSANGLNNNYTNAAVKSVYIWGAQLVEGSTAKDYQKTETRLNIPRLDYSNGTCPSLLVEPQRTNLLTWSSSFDNAAWSKTDASIIASAIISLDGLVNASKLNDNTNNAQHGILRFIVGLASPTTISFFVKEAEYSRCCIENYSDGGRVVFNISTMSVVSTSSNFTNATVEEYANGFIRVSATTVGTSGNKAFGLGLINNSGQNSFVGTGTSGIYVYGAQAEAGSYATSYIPTTSAAVTRNADVISKTGISSLIGQTEGTLFVDVKALPVQSSDSGTYLSIEDWGNFELVRIYRDSTSIYVQIYNSANIYLGNYAISNNQNYKVAIAYSQTGASFYINGTLINENISSLSIPTCSNVRIGSFTSGQETNASIKSAALWKTRLTNTQLAQLTTI